MNELPTRSEPCACGDVITIWDPTDSRIQAAMRRHVRNPMHQAWRGLRYHQCAGVGSPCAVTIPMDRTLCFYCSRTVALIERATA